MTADEIPNGFRVWQPPETFRDSVDDTERLAAQLVDALSGQLLISVPDIEFLARRVHQLARTVQQSLPAGVI